MILPTSGQSISYTSSYVHVFPCRDLYMYEHSEPPVRLLFLLFFCIYFRMPLFCPSVRLFSHFTLMTRIKVLFLIACCILMSPCYLPPYHTLFVSEDLPDGSSLRVPSGTAFRKTKHAEQLRLLWLASKAPLAKREESCRGPTHHARRTCNSGFETSAMEAV